MRSITQLAIALAIVSGMCVGQQGPNLVRNGSAELGNSGNGFQLFQLPDWVGTTMSMPTNVDYNLGTGFPDSADPGVVDGGRRFFAGGPNTSVSSMQQRVDVSAAAAAIDSGSVSCILAADIGGFGSQGDNARVSTRFQDGSISLISFGPSLAPVTPAERLNQTGFVLRGGVAVLPAGTRYITVIVDFERLGSGTYCDGYIDNISLFLSPDPMLSATPAGGTCGEGTLRATTVRAPFDVLGVGFSAGDSSRNVTLGIGQNIGLTIQSPYASDESVAFAIFGLVDQGTYSASDLVLFPGIGTSCIPLLNGDPRAFVVADSVGLGGALNGSFGGPTATPWGTTLSGGIGVPFTMVLQGALVSPSGNVDLTNAVRLVVQ